MTPKPAAKKLETWYRTHRRSLPWRKSHDPYRIWISEIMLQQTQVTTVIPYFERFISRFPTIQSLANAEETDVFALWAGLGYYSRARNLMKGARYLVNNHDGKIPRDRNQVLDIPGIGPYTAGAILSIAYNLRVPIVDGNVARVFARYYGIRKSLKEGSTQKRLWESAEDWVEKATEPRELNQALMELGAMICRKGKPLCESCPIARDCVARLKGWTDELPLTAPRKKAVELFWVKMLWERNGKFFLQKNPKGQWWADLWDFPYAPASDLAEVPQSVEKLKKKYGGRWKELNHRKHTVTHHKLHVIPYHCQLSKKPNEPGEWVSEAELSRFPVSSLAKKIITSYRDEKPSP